MSYQSELEDEYLEQIAASAKSAVKVTGHDPRLLWRYGGWLQPNFNAAPAVADPAKAYDSGAISFEPGPEGVVVTFKSLDRHTEHRLQQFARFTPPPEGLNVVFKSLDGETFSPEEILGTPPAATVASKTAAGGAAVPEVEEEEEPEDEGEAAETWDIRDPEDPEVERDEPATAPVPAPRQQAPTPAPAAPAAVEPEEEAGIASPEMDARAEIELEVSDPETIEAVIEFLREENLLERVYQVIDGFSNWDAAANMATVKVGRSEYVIAPTESDAEQLALEMVRGQLESDPDLFSKSWLEGYISEDKLRDYLRHDVEEDVRRDPEAYGWEPPSEDEEEEEEREDVKPRRRRIEKEQYQMDFDPEPPEPTDEWVEEKVEDILEDPMEYMRGMYGDEAEKHAMDWVGFNEDEAARDSLSAEGAAYFLSPDEREIHHLPSGGVWWKSH
jgi:hypothetical protein